MKSQFIILIFATLIITSTKAQTDTLGPLNWTKPINVESNDVFIIWNEEDENIYNTYQKVYKYKIEGLLSPVLDPDTMISKTPKQVDSRWSPNPSQFIDIAKGRFNEGPYDDVVSIWPGATGIEVLIPKFDTAYNMWSSSIQHTIDIPPAFGRVYVRTGNFIDNDSFDEFIVANLDEDHNVHIRLYDVDSTLNPTLVDESSVINLEHEFSWANMNYFIEAGDLNDDGKDEIVLQFKPMAVNASGWDISVKIFEIMDGIISPRAQSIIQPKPASTIIYNVTMATTIGQFTSDTKKELAFITVMNETAGPRAYVYLLEVSSDLMEIIFDPEKRILRNLQGSISTVKQLSMDAGDLNHDGIDEIVFTAGPRIYVHTTDDGLGQSIKNDTGFAEGGTETDYQQSYNFLKTADVNNDNHQDIVVVRNFMDTPFEEGLYVAMLKWDDDIDSLSLLGRYFGDENQGLKFRNYAIEFGNFDGMNFKIGQPSHYVASEIVQPVVILNAPPIHFDKFEDDVFDINTCYSGNDCEFVATYKKEISTDSITSISVSAAYAISTGLSVEGSTTIGGSVEATPLGVGVTAETSITQNYERHILATSSGNFGRYSSNSTTVTIGMEIDAREDDWIYSTVSSYDIYEYPIYHGNETFARNTILTFVPNNVQATWFPSKGINALNYIPDHEVGNILSYQDYDDFDDNPNSAQTIEYSSDAVELNINSDFDWNVTYEAFSGTTVEAEINFGLDIGYSLGPIRFDGDFNTNIMSTHHTSVSELIELQVHLGSIDESIGEVNYTVTPYAYWGKNGAMIVDYAAAPGIGPQGGFNTWWQEKYGTNSDPTFILPWRLDPEKGFAISDPVKRQQTKDITFSPTVPYENDTLTIITRVRNFSLIPTPTSVSVSFYIGDPDEGGTPIVGINGTNTVYTNGIIDDRGRSDVEIKWIVPGDLPSFPRIYAVLDEEDLIPEIHTNNNKGFNILGAPATPPSNVNENILFSDGYALQQSYPNPFSSITTIEYTIPLRERTVVKVIDFYGREVETLIDKIESAGTYIIPFDGSKLSNGIYYYTIRSGSYFESKKMILLK